MRPELSPREWEVARHVAAHLRIPDIAKVMTISETSVHRHLHNIRAKWGLDPKRDVCSQIAVRLSVARPAA